jgi:hypothetical protein
MQLYAASGGSMRALKNHRNSYWLLLLLLLPGLAIIAVYLVNSTASVVGDATPALQAAPLNPAFVEYLQKQQGDLRKDASQEPNYGYAPPTVDLSHMERLRAPQN